MLHILMNSPIASDFQALLRAIGYKDELLLLSDGVIAGVVDSIVYNKLLVVSNTYIVIIYALEDDVRARGLFNYISKIIYIINYMEFVALTEKHNLCLSW